MDLSDPGVRLALRIAADAWQIFAGLGLMWVGGYWMWMMLMESGGE